MHWIDQYQLFLFDFDGLLVDTEALHYTAYVEMSRRRGYPLNWDFATFCREAHSKPMGFFDGLQKEYPHAFKEGPSKDVLYEEKKQIFAELLPSFPLKLMEGVEPLLCLLKEKKVRSAVVTNSPKSQIEIIKKSLPVLQNISVWVTREDYSHPKPSPEGYLKAISYLAEPGDRIIGFEDTLKGLKALLAAGAQAVLICPPEAPDAEEGQSLGAKHFSSLSAITNTINI